ncbi:MAG TPA: GGDEF domain-containing protein [Thermoleophilaceae bacterium]|nr:GGDEF domain-containing protein [Thermoleophilaceae bacterium]
MDSRDPYAGADLSTSRRFQAGLLGLCGLLTLAFLPFEPVDDQIGDAGWAIAAGLGLLAIGGAVLILRREPSFDDLLVMAYSGIAGIAMLNYLAGGGSSAYEDLYVLWLGTGAAHPARRAIPHLATMVAALTLPLLYEGTSGEIVKDMAAEALILMVLGAILTAYQTGVRRQRAGLEAGAEVERRLARVDELTGLGNRRAFDEAITVEGVRASRERVPLSVGLVDVDNLRRINDQFGHLAGDAILRDVARAMERGVRAGDGCFRWGGDEFVVVMPGTEQEAAGEVLGRMAQAVGEACQAPDGRSVGLTWGVAKLDSGGTAEDLLAAADLSLLERKTEERR